MEYAQLSAAKLAQACRDTGNLEAWQEFCRRFERRMLMAIFSVARSHNRGSSETGDEILQETYVQIVRDGCEFLEKLQFATDGEATAILCDLASKTAKTFFRKARRKKRFAGKPLPIENLDSLEFPSEKGAGALAIEQRILARQLMNKLRQARKPTRFSSRDELIFRLRYQRGFTHRQIAEIPRIGLSIIGVEKSLRRSLAMLRAAIAPRE